LAVAKQQDSTVFFPRQWFAENKTSQCQYRIASERGRDRAGGEKIARLSPIDEPPSQSRGCLDFRKAAGLGKEVWKDVDVDAYIRQKRDEWA